MRYNTGNPVGPDGSSSPFDLHDNSGVIDLLMNGPLGEYLSRLGVPLKSWVGIMQQVTDYLIDQGYESVYLAYGAGVVVERQTQLVQREGELYRVMNAADIPLTLTGTWATDSPKLQAVGDAALRQALALPGGSGMSGFDRSQTYPSGTVGAQLKAIPHLDLGPAVDKAQALIDFAASLGGKTGRVEPGTYTMTKQVNLPGNVDLDLSDVVLDFSAASVASFPDLICLRPAPGSLVQLPALSADTVIGSYSITFSAAHNLAPGEAIILHDDKPSSYSAFRTNYYQGQFAVVRSVSGLTVNLTAPILASMSIVLDGNGKGLKIYKMNPTRPKIRGGTILMPTSGVLIAGLLTDVTRNAQVEYTRVFGTSGGGIIHQRALGATTLFCETYSDRESAAADNYGLGLSNSHHCLVSGGTFHARRHGVTMGGADIPGGVPTRFCLVDGAETSSWDVQGSDMHGNVEHCQYVNCIHRNGITIGGNHNSIRGGTVFAPAQASTGNGVAISINEMRGTSFLFEGFKIIADGDPQTTSRGVIDCGGNSNSMTADTILGGCMTFRNIDIDAPNARIPIKIVNRGSTATGKTVDIKINCPNSPATRTSNGIVQNVSGTPFESARFEADFPNAGAPAGTTMDATKVRGMRESGVATTTTDATTFKDVSITFSRRFPKAPSMRLNGNLSAAGTNIFYTPISVTPNGATLRIYTTGANMTAGVAVNLMWGAVLDE